MKTPFIELKAWFRLKSLVLKNLIKLELLSEKVCWDVCEG